MDRIIRLIISTFIALIFCKVKSTYQSPVLQVQLHERKLSDYNDTAYVSNIMRRAKAAEMRNYMKPDVDACDNFFQYACGNWAKIYPADQINSDETNFFEHLSISYDNKQVKLLEGPSSSEDPEPDAKVKNYFQSCLHVRNIPPSDYSIKLKEIVAEFGHMPILALEGQEWPENEFDWLSTIAKIQNKYGINIILQMGIITDFWNKTVNKLYIGQPAFTLKSKSMYINADTELYRNIYLQNIKRNLVQHLGLQKDAAISTATEILNFETELSKALMDKKLGKKLSSMSVLRTLDAMKKAYAPTIDFEQYIQLALGHLPNDTFYEFVVDYQVNLVEVIKKTPKRVVANYIFYQLLESFFYNNKLAASQQCFKKTKSIFANVLDNMIFRKYNNERIIREVKQIWSKIKETFKAEIESERLNWIATTTRQLALNKLEAMTLEINSYENSNFTSEYAELEMHETNYIGNLKSVLIFKTKRKRESLHEVPKPIEAPLTLSYSPAHIATENVIKIPMLLLQPNYMWSDYYPTALKFGTLGYLIAHELIHGFDDIGRNYDIDGHETNWWDPESTAAFNVRKACFKRQYARYRYGGKYLPESELQAENIADNGAVQIAYGAYINWLRDAQQEEENNEIKNETLKLEVLPNMNFSSKQLFFISFAQFWCNDVNQHFKEKVSLIDTHAPSMFRVIGSLANFDQFSKEFACSSGTAMNPDQKCHIY